MDHTRYFTEKSRIRFYQADHYRRDYNVENVYKQLNTIPKEAKVSAQSPFVPHLSLRNHIYQFPLIKDARYLVFSYKEKPYPFTSRKKMKGFIRQIINSKKWIVQYKNADLTVLKKDYRNTKE